MIPRNVSFMMMSLFTLCLALILAACGGGTSNPQALSATSSPTSQPQQVEVQTTDNKGHALFSEVCALCHGPAGTGITGLGKDLVESKFVGALTDEQLLLYIRSGRGPDDPLNTTGIDMPPSGARPDLSDEQLLNIIAHIRTLNTQAGVDSAEAAQYLAQLERDDALETEETVASDVEDEAVENADIAVSADAVAGQHLFAEVCAPCHNQKGSGIQGIGVNLTSSRFVGGLTIPQLADFINIGRELNNPFNLIGVRMPARGGRPDLSADDMLNIAAYLHSINSQVGVESGQVTEYLAWVETGGVTDMESVAEVSREGLAGAALDGQTTFLRFCAVCHAPQGQGVESLGKSLIDSDFVASLTGNELVEFISTGRPADDPLNTTGIEMLPYGGQESLSAEDLSNLVAYVRFINDSLSSLAVRPSDVEEDQGEEASDEDAETYTAAKEKALAIIDRLDPNCFVCHKIADRGNKNGPGPNLNELSKQIAAERIPGLSAREYIEQSILEPSVFLVVECPSGPCIDTMPENLGEELSEEELETLVDFFLSLAEHEQK